MKKEEHSLLFFHLKQGDLAGLRHTGEGTQGLELLDMGLGELVAAHGELLDGDEGFALALFHRVQRRRLAHAAVKGGRRPFFVTLNLVASES